jgi:hypothetical protein
MRRTPALLLNVLAPSALVLTLLALPPTGGVAVADGNAWPPTQTRMYYLTKGYFTGVQVLQACARGYHFASVWELNPSVLAYNTRLGFQNAPYQMGPPTTSGYDGPTFGWIDNGREAEPNANCLGWTNEGGYFGMSMSFADSPGTYSRQLDCSETSRVWCISNP